MRPRHEVPMIWDRYDDIGAKIRVDPHERLWPSHTTWHTEAQPVGLTGTVVRILSDDHYPRVFAPSELERAEDLIIRRVDGIGKGRTPFLDKRRELFPVPVRELVLEQSTPVRPAQRVRRGHPHDPFATPTCLHPPLRRATLQEPRLHSNSRV